MSDGLKWLRVGRNYRATGAEWRYTIANRGDSIPQMRWVLRVVAVGSDGETRPIDHARKLSDMKRAALKIESGEMLVRLVQEVAEPGANSPAV